MTVHRSVRLVAAFLVLGLTAALLAPPRPSPAVAGRGHHGHKGKVVWDSKPSTPAPAPVAAHGRVPGGKTKVKLQVKLPGGWQTFGKARSSRKGKFAISGGPELVRHAQVRVSTTGRHALQPQHQGHVLHDLRPARQPGRPRLLQRPGRTRYSFDPCKTVRYVVNADDVGPSGILLAQLGMAQVSLATGIR